MDSVQIRLQPTSALDLLYPNCPINQWVASSRVMLKSWTKTRSSTDMIWETWCSLLFFANSLYAYLFFKACRQSRLSNYMKLSKSQWLLSDVCLKLTKLLNMSRFPKSCKWQFPSAHLPLHTNTPETHTWLLKMRYFLHVQYQVDAFISLYCFLPLQFLLNFPLLVSSTWRVPWNMTALSPALWNSTRRQ